MTTLAELLDPRAVDRLEAVRAEAVRRERQDAEAATSTPVAATCPACGQARPVPAAVFRCAP